MSQMGLEELADRAAPLDALLVDAALGPMRRLAPNSSTVRFAARLARHPVATGRRLGSLAAELARVGVGISTVAPSKRDRRFADPAWSQNPLLHRVVQGYLAAGRTAEVLLDDAGLDWRDDQRVRFLVENVVEALSPSNIPLVNPASAKAAIDTAGGNLARGGVSFLRDMAASPRIPEMVDTSPFEVGRTVAVTPGAVVLRTEVLELIQYRPQTARVREIPLLIAPPTINKYYVLDLAPGRSLVEYLVRGGQQVFVISWCNPDARHAEWGLDTYVQSVLDALDAVQRICGTDRAALTGFCSGGIIASIAAAHLASTGRQDRLAAFGLGVTVLDNARAGTAAALADRRLAAAATALSRRRGYLDGRSLAEVFAWLRPGDLVWNYWVNNYLLGRKPPAFDILFWNADTTRMPARLHADFVTVAMDNSLTIPAATTVLGGTRRPVAHRGRHLPRRRDRRPPDNLAELLPQHATARRGEPVRAVHERPHRRAGQPAGQRQGQLPGEQGEPRRRTGVAADRADRAGQLVAGLPGLARRAVRRRGRGARGAGRRRPTTARRRPRHLRLRHLRRLTVYENIGRSRGTDYFRIADQLTREELDYLRRTRDFVDDKVLPVVNGYWERAEFPWPLVQQLGKLGVVGDGIEGYGCPPMSPIATGLVHMELNRGDGSLGTFLGVQAGLAMQSIAMLGSEDQKQRWLPSMAALDKLGAFALTEPLHGSDSVALETSARRNGDEWVINGEKKWIGNGTLADVGARDVTDGQVKGFLVEKGPPGYAATRIDGKRSLRAVWQAEITLNDLRVPAENRLPGAQLQGHRPGARRHPQRGGLGRARPCHRRVRGRHGVLRSAAAVRQTAGELPDRAGEAGRNARRDLLYAAVLPAPGPAHRGGPADRHDRRDRQDEQHPQGPPGHRRGPRPARRQRHPAGLPRHPAHGRHRGDPHLRGDRDHPDPHRRQRHHRYRRLRLTGR
jgi:polyhydroxyalkanoate synthase subunit PhaC